MLSKTLTIQGLLLGATFVAFTHVQIGKKSTFHLRQHMITARGGAFPKRDGKQSVSGALWHVLSQNFSVLYLYVVTIVKH